ncbi:hypothetical protein AB0M36_22575 [Actinoplanes sp. NPDC051346]|uniref:hypothetical protein n=1 Tax=Actinoplanes sp. NPDC051346 TaxID=3155048 RepID=UPI00343F8CBA
MTLDVRVLGADLDAEQIQECVRSLRTSILAADVDDARPAVAGSAPAGAKSGEMLAVGALMVTLAPTVLEAMMGVVASWLSRQPDDIEMEIDGQRFRGHVTKAQRDDMVAAYLRRLDETQ